MCTPEHGSVKAEIKAEEIPVVQSASELDASVAGELESITNELMGLLKFDGRKELKTFLLSQDATLNPEGADALCQVLLDGRNRLIPAYEPERIDGLRASFVAHLERKGIKRDDLAELGSKLAGAKEAIKALETRKD